MRAVDDRRISWFICMATANGPRNLNWSRSGLLLSRYPCSSLKLLGVSNVLPVSARVAQAPASVSQEMTNNIELLSIVTLIYECSRAIFSRSGNNGVRYCILVHWRHWHFLLRRDPIRRYARSNLRY